jgi:type I restriction enzyme S subunit
VKEPVAYPDTMIRARVDESLCDPEYLRLVWDSSAVRRQIEASARTTAGIYKVNQKDLGSIRIPVPSLAEQKLMVKRMSVVREGLDAAEVGIEGLERRISDLRRALLRAAFQGRLTERDQADEPAMLLLQRIAEKRRTRQTNAPRRTQRTVASAAASAGSTAIEESA